jgi:hypothetical protein
MYNVHCTCLYFCVNTSKSEKTFSDEFSIPAFFTDTLKPRRLDLKCVMCINCKQSP